MKLKIKYLLKILIINYFLLEILCFILLLTPFIPNGLSLMTSVVAHKDFSVQHIPNRTYNFAYKCWESKVFFNKDGNRKYSNNPNAFKIALLGDSMVENAQLSDGKDLGSLLQKRLGDKFEVTNFGILSTGIYDHLQIYKKKDLKNYDLLIYFIDPTDLDDNHFSRNRPNQNMFKIENNKLKKMPHNEDYWKNYFSTFNEIKRKHLFYFKKYSNIFKVYWFAKESFMNSKVDNSEKEKILFTDQIEDLNEPLKIYDHFSKEFLVELDKNKQNFLIIPNLRRGLFERSDFEIFKYNYLKKAWNIDKKIEDPYLAAVKFLENKNMNFYPYLSWSCDPHYSHNGAKFFSIFISNAISKFDDFK